MSSIARLQPLRPFRGVPSLHGRDARAQTYDRARDLPPLIALWPYEVADQSAAGRQRLIAKLKRALREERRRGVAGHWTYSLTRHAGLLRAYRHELILLGQRCGARGAG